MTEIDIRPGKESDLPEIVSIFHRSFVPMIRGYHHEIDVSNFTVEEFSKIWEKYFQLEGTKIFIAALERNAMHENVAVLALIPTEHANVIELAKLFVLPDIQSGGIGKQMTQFAMDIAKNLGYRSMELWTWEISYQSTGLYESFGFVDTGERSLSGYRGVDPKRDVTIKYSLKL